MTIINIDEEIGYLGVDSKQISKQIQESTGDLLIKVNSPGGSVYDGIEIYNSIKAYAKGKTTCQIGALAASMGSIIALSADETTSHSTSIYMIHNPMTVSFGNQHDLKKDIAVLEGMTKIMLDIYEENSSLTRDQLIIMMDDETYLFGDEIVENGFSSKIVDKKSEILDKQASIVFAKERFAACLRTERNLLTSAKRDQISACSKTKEDIKNEFVEKQEKNDIISQTKNTGEIMSLEETETASMKAVSIERIRMSKIMALDCDNTLKSQAIESGISAGDFAYELQLAQTNRRLEEKKAFEQDSMQGNIDTPLPTSKSPKAAEAEAEDAADEAYYAKHMKGRR